MLFDMDKQKMFSRLALVLAMSSSSIASAAEIEELEVIADRLFADTHKVNPSSKISAEELQAINLMTTEDAVAYEPSLVIRRRYVGDPNGVMGIRATGMFQTARSLVFADGLPLHYLLQTRWSGSPRWSLVGANEIESAEVLYGPYSAEYSGNAMGGVVNIKTKLPQERKFTLQGSLIQQDYDYLGTDDNFNGNKVFASYEDKIGELGIFASYNRLKNESQPMSAYYLDASEAQSLTDAGVSGFVTGKNDDGDEVIYIGDSGAETSTTELYKLKLNYSLGDVQLRATVAYEDRSREEESKNNYLRDSNGDLYWGSGNRNFEQRQHQRNSLLLGFGLSGELSGDWFYDVYATDFDIKKDREVRSGLNPQDPSFGSRNGRLTAYQDTGWNTLDIKLGTENLFNNEAMRLSLGYYFDRYELGIVPSNIDAVNGAFISTRAQSQGQTSSQALFAQWGWQLNTQLDLSLGLRYEDWQTEDGFYNNIVAANRGDSGWSPKLSLAYTFNDDWSIRYSAAKALRFPIAEELYRNEEASSSIIVGDASLGPEEGMHHNVSIERTLEQGLLRLNVFYEEVDNTIYNQSGVINDGGTHVNVSTFLAIDEVKSRGVEFIYQQQGLFELPLSLRYNLSYTRATIEQNLANPAIEGNDVPRVPRWRSNMIISYALNDAIDLSSSFRYASDSHGDLDNQAGQKQVYGAIDGYLFANAKLGWKLDNGANLSFGVDNLFDQRAYVSHPWPARTFYLEGRYTF